MPFYGQSSLQRNSTATLTIANDAPAVLAATTLLIDERGRITAAESHTVPGRDPGGNGSVAHIPIVVGDRTDRVIVLLAPPPGPAGTGAFAMNGEAPHSFESDMQLTYNTVA